MIQETLIIQTLIADGFDVWCLHCEQCQTSSLESMREWVSKLKELYPTSKWRLAKKIVTTEIVEVA